MNGETAMGKGGKKSGRSQRCRIVLPHDELHHFRIRVDSAFGIHSERIPHEGWPGIESASNGTGVLHFFEGHCMFCKLTDQKSDKTSPFASPSAAETHATSYLAGIKRLLE
jgi:hypothetical protein